MRKTFVLTAVFQLQITTVFNKPYLMRSIFTNYHNYNVFYNSLVYIFLIKYLLKLFLRYY